MKALESAPERYDKGISWLGWGELGKIREHMADIAKTKGETVLEIGVGTGTQALMNAERGLSVVGIDQSSGMLSIAQSKLDKAQDEIKASGKDVPKVKFLQMAAVEIDEFPDDSFDIVTSTLVFSELFHYERKYVLAHALRILKPGGTLILADETIPRKRLKRLAHRIISLPLKLITYLMTQTSTKPLDKMVEGIEEVGFVIDQTEEYQLGAFQVVVAHKPEDSDLSDRSSTLTEPENLSPLKTRFFSTLWQTVTRMMPHSTEIGLIPIGTPTQDSPVLCTCNFKLTVQRLCNLLEKKKIDAWVLVAPTGGDNVWCASAGGKFNAESVITAIKVSHLEEYVDHRKIILPQLAAPGVNPKRIRKATGWHCNWGPVQMNDLPEYLENFPASIRNKTEKQRKVTFDIHHRLEMALVLVFPMVLFFESPLFLVLTILGFWIWILPLFLETIIFYLGVFLLWPKIPLRLGTKKVGLYSLVFLLGLVIGSWLSIHYFGFSFQSGLASNGYLSLLNWWPLQLFMLVLAGMLWYDADGSTPTQRSSLLAKAWNKGKTNVMERWGSRVTPTQYGMIRVNIDLCTGCGICVDVCPTLIPEIDGESKKVHLRNTESCINCRACINQCPTKVLFLEPETEAARHTLESFQGES
ncbi:MAG: HgcAB-like fusion protein [Candidatus Thorarchaeota archaeon]